MYHHPQLPPPLHSPGDSPRSARRSVALGPSACGILCALSTSEASIAPSLVGLLQLSLSGLQCQMLCGLGFLLLDPWVGESDVGLRFLTPVGEPPQYNDSPVCGSPTLRVWDLVTLRPCPSYPYHCGSLFISLVVGDLFWEVPVIFINGDSADSCDFGVLMRGGERRSWCSTVLAALPGHLGILLKQRFWFSVTGK